jgi:hypothetical protein
MGGNWRWRMTAEQFDGADAGRLKQFATVYQR